MNSIEKAHVIDLQEWRLHGLVVLPSIFGMMLLAIHPYALGVMFEPLEQEFGWTRSQISAGPLVTSLVALILSPFGGRAVDKYGPRVIALIGIPAFAGALALISTAGPSIYSWLALYALLAVALIFIFPTVWTAAVAERFFNNRGLALAITLSGTGLAAAIVPFAASRLIEAYGWRGAYVGMGATAFIFIFPLVLMLFARDRPPSGRMEEVQINPESQGKLAEYRSAKFFYLTIAALIYSIGSTGLAINAVPILMGEGFSLLIAAEIVGFIGIGVIVGRIVGGFLLDRMDGRYVAIGCAVAALVSAAILLATVQSTLAASVACFLLGLAAGAEFDACAYLATRHFARRSFGAVFGVVSGLSGFGSGISPLIANGVYDLTGSYDAVLWGIIPLFLVAGLLFMALGPYPDEVTEVEDFEVSI